MVVADFGVEFGKLAACGEWLDDHEVDTALLVLNTDGVSDGPDRARYRRSADDDWWVALEAFAEEHALEPIVCSVLAESSTCSLTCAHLHVPRSHHLTPSCMVYDEPLVLSTLMSMVSMPNWRLSAYLWNPTATILMAA